jgi:hypothetical protein
MRSTFRQKLKLVFSKRLPEFSTPTPDTPEKHDRAWVGLQPEGTPRMVSAVGLAKSYAEVSETRGGGFTGRPSWNMLWPW